MVQLETPLTELLSIETPIIQAPIGGATTPELVATVSNAGALGMLSLTWRSPEEARELIRQTRLLTSKPFGINLVLEWDPSDRLAIAIEEQVALISFFWGDPGPWIADCHAADILVSHSVGSPQEAVRSVEQGVDFIVAQGVEAGGHVWGEVGTMALVPAVADAIPGTPVVAAGGIADGRGFAAALALGAAGIWMGTRFLLAREAPIHTEYRSRLERSSVTDTVLTDIFDDGWPNAPLRTLRNPTYEAWVAAGRPSPDLRTDSEDVIAIRSDGSDILRYQGDFPTEDVTGDLASMVQYAGQSVGLIDRSACASEIVETVTAQAVEVMVRLGADHRSILPA
ncbi:enoyl-[acyl-carrier-protein] reductase FabK [soil metagenome]